MYIRPSHSSKGCTWCQIEGWLVECCLGWHRCPIAKERRISASLEFQAVAFLLFQGQRASLNSAELNGLTLTPPEIKQGQPPSPASDMYAFGCLLYWVCNSLFVNASVWLQNTASASQSIMEIIWSKVVSYVLSRMIIAIITWMWHLQNYLFGLSLDHL